MTAPGALRPYVLADPFYYEKIGHARADDLLELIRARVGDRADVHTCDMWAGCTPRSLVQLPEYGWKLHISSRPVDIEAVVGAVLDEWATAPFAFTCLRDSSLAVEQLARWWPRETAGMAITVYPATVPEAKDLADRLAKRLSGYDGPFIRTDRRYRESRVVHYRYGTIRVPRAVDWYGHRGRSATPPRVTEDPFVEGDPATIASVSEHTFLVESRVPGTPLPAWLARHHPFVQGSLADGRAVAEFRERVAGLMDQLRTAIEACVDRGQFFPDVSPANLLVDDQDVLRLVDFGGCRPADSDPNARTRTPGYAPRQGTSAHRTDKGWLRFAVAAIEAECIAPRNALLELDVAAFGRSLRHAAGLLDWPVDELLNELDEGAPGIRAAAGTDDPRPDPATVAGELARHLRAAATPHRVDRLFPADPELFETNALSIGYGATGVLRALRYLDGEVDERHLRWLRHHLDENPPLPPGLYIGTAGIGVALLELGAATRGASMLRAAGRRAVDDPSMPADVVAGRAGIGLAMLAAAGLTRDPDYLELAHGIADRLLREARDDGAGLWWEPAGERRSIGYLHGSSGIAGFLTALAETTGEQELVRPARRALEFDLAHARDRPHGGLGFAGSDTDLPYFERGGAGVGMAVARLYAATHDPDLAATLRDIVRGVVSPVTPNAGLYLGMTGIAEFLLDCREVLPDDADLMPMLAPLVTQICALRCIVDGEGAALPGDGLLRCSCDVATGSAGVAMLLKRLHDGTSTADLRYGRSALGALDG